MTVMGNGSGSGNQGTGQGAGSSGGDGSGGGNSGGSGGSNGGGQGGSGSGGSGTGDGGQGGSGGGGTASWRDALPADLKGHTSLQSFSTVENLAKSYIHAQGMIGKKGHILPNDKSSPEDWNATWDALGRPPLDKYEVKGPKDRETDEEFITRFKQAAHKSGMLPKQAQEMLDWYMTDSQTAIDAQMSEVRGEGEKQLTGLRTEWGKDWDLNVKRAQRAADHVSPDFRKWLESSGMGNDVQIIRALSSLGKLLGEEPGLKGDGGGGGMGMDRGQVDAEIAQIRNQPEYSSFEDSPKKRQLHARISELYQMRSG